MSTTHDVSSYYALRELFSSKTSFCIQCEAVRGDTHVDRRRLLTQILKNGMNLVVLTSVFDEDEGLSSRFPEAKQSTRMLYNSLNPIFQETYGL